jgi:hypothetical protein
VANEHRNRLVDKQIRDLVATTANDGALIRWSRVGAQLPTQLMRGDLRDQLKQLICGARLCRAAKRVGAGTAKSEQHQRAVRARWDRRAQEWAAARGGA